MIDKMSFTIGWLQAFADAEGYVGSRGKGRREIVISNTLEELLIYYQEGLKALGSYSSLCGPYHHTDMPNATPIYRLRIQRIEDLRKWAKLVGFSHPQKRDKLESII